MPPKLYPGKGMYLTYRNLEMLGVPSSCRLDDNWSEMLRNYRRYPLGFPQLRTKRMISWTPFGTWPTAAQTVGADLSSPFCQHYRLSRNQFRL